MAASKLAATIAAEKRVEKLNIVKISIQKVKKENPIVTHKDNPVKCKVIRHNPDMPGRHAGIDLAPRQTKNH
jgi:hypothetical protein